MTKRKTYYPRAATGKRRTAPAGPDTPAERPTLATINLAAGAGRAGFAVGDRVVIGGSGMYAGETAVIERLSEGVIPSAFVRTESGNTRQVRTIDLSRPPKEQPASD